jgi:hypothetical protein
LLPICYNSFYSLSNKIDENSSISICSFILIRGLLSFVLIVDAKLVGSILFSDVRASYKKSYFNAFRIDGDYL